MAEKLTLKNPGDTAVIKITQVPEKAKFGKYPGIEFTGTMLDGREVTLEVPVGSVERQLSRPENGKRTPAECVGMTIRFHRSPSDDPMKPWWDLEVQSPSTPGVQGLAKLIKPGVEGQPGTGPAAPLRKDLKAVGADLPPWADVPPPDDRDAPPDAVRSQPEAAPVAPGTALPTRREKMDLLFELYDECLAHAAVLGAEYAITDQPAIGSMAATIFIEANRRGIR